MANNIFTGASRYSNDFQAVIDRAIAMASLPKIQMQQNRVRLSAEASAFREVKTALSALRDAIQPIENSTTTEFLTATSSDPGVLRATAGAGMAEATYNVEVVSVGSYSTAVAKTDINPKTSDPASGNYTASSSLSLTITDKDNIAAAVNVSISLTGKTLNDVVAAINAQAGASVTATAVNVGSSADPNYQLSIQSKTYGKLALQLSDGSNQLLDVDATQSTHKSYGSRVEYVVNGATVKTDTRSITISPGLTAELLKSAPGTTVTVTAGRSLSSFKTAIGRFVSAFNTVVQAVNNNTASGRPLAGNNVVSSLMSFLRKIPGSSIPSSRFKSPALLGLEFTKEGTLNFDQTVFEREVRNADTKAVYFDDLASFVGTAKTSGFAKVATDILNTLNETNTGLMDGVIDSLDDAVKAQDARIAAEEERIDRLQTDLQTRMMAADSTIAMLEQQVTYFNGMWDAMRTASRSYNG